MAGKGNRQPGVEGGGGRRQAGVVGRGRRAGAKGQGMGGGGTGRGEVKQDEYEDEQEDEDGQEGGARGRRAPSLRTSIVKITNTAALQSSATGAKNGSRKSSLATGMPPSFFSRGESDKLVGGGKKGLSEVDDEGLMRGRVTGHAQGPGEAEMKLLSQRLGVRAKQVRGQLSPSPSFRAAMLAQGAGDGRRTSGGSGMRGGSPLRRLLSGLHTRNPGSGHSSFSIPGRLGFTGEVITESDGEFMAMVASIQSKDDKRGADSREDGSGGSIFASKRKVEATVEPPINVQSLPIIKQC
ncbi:hypothetical protein CBR_g37807 [Chara braunii]|uniref:Uncharacterized protein n=1 Tax=Chara braunii TaxID=69332 RepID=A0A388LNX4_CHABU|nr:hypothetical protein CBR_g37807 [Chara braunii]|eukprot:GBG83935.1 hypothetical protein CBR_g37807 [Chara braunii]